MLLEKVNCTVLFPLKAFQIAVLVPDSVQYLSHREVNNSLVNHLGLNVNMWTVRERSGEIWEM